jgi:hypothetical protein
VPVFKLADEHPLTKAGLRCVYVVEKAELGLRPGDIVFEFPFGRIVDTSMACRRDGIIPPEIDIDIMAIHKEANATRAALPRRSQLIGSTLAAARGERFTIAKTGEGRSLTPQPRRSRGMSAIHPASSMRARAQTTVRVHRMPAGATRSLMASKTGARSGCRPGSARQTSPTNRAMPR